MLCAGLLLDLVGRDLLSPAVCLSVSIVQHGMFLAVFFWTNVMAYDIWQAIGTLTPYRTHPTLRKDKYGLFGTRLILHQIYFYIFAFRRYAICCNVLLYSLCLGMSEKYRKHNHHYQLENLQA